MKTKELVVAMSVFALTGWVEAESDFIVGADLSALTIIEKEGGLYSENGESGECLEILERNGFNLTRLRIFVEPQYQEEFINYDRFVANDIAYTLELAKRVKASGQQLMLDFHYSDVWADPGKQYKPKSWEGLSLDDLVRQVEGYTVYVMETFARHGIVPEYVQVGNEVTNGMIWPEGKLDYSADGTGSWDRFRALVDAGIRGVRSSVGDQSLVMIQIENPGMQEKCYRFFREMKSLENDYDVIGMSYYPFYHGDFETMKETLNGLVEQHDKPLMVVETAYPYFPSEAFENGKWIDASNMIWPMSIEGQQAFFEELVDAVRCLPNNRGVGVVLWHPEMVPLGEFSGWMEGANSVFGRDGELLPSVVGLTSGKVSTTEQVAGLR